jgi:hypothetical protein
MTLRRLRSAGVESLEDFLRRPEPALASMLKAARPMVRHLQEEGRLLARRLARSPLEPELPSHTDRPTELVRRLRIRPGAQAYEPGPSPAPPSPALVQGGLEASPPIPPAEPIVRVVAAAQGELSHAPPRPVGAASHDLRPQGPGPTRPVDGPATAEAEARDEERDEAPLRANEVEGLDRRTCEKLVREGVRSYRALADLANLSLARRMGITYPRLLDLSFAAREHLRSLAPLPIAGRAESALDARTEAGQDVRTVTVRPAPPPARAGALDPEPRRSSPRDLAREEPGVAGPFV